MSAGRDIHIRVEGRAGRITLCRPQVLNALTYEMVTVIERALLEWRTDSRVALVIIDAEGDRAFCSGGDVEELYRTGKAGDFAFGRRFWTDEYRLNALIAEYPKPYVALMQGFTMGGGVGISCHGSHRIVCESSMIAMPECGIGLVPDVGGSFLLSRAPGRTGEYLGLTGQRMNAGDAIYAGFADCFVPRAKWRELVATLIGSGGSGKVADFAQTPPAAPVAGLRRIKDRFFDAPSAAACVNALNADGSPWAIKTAAQIRRGCPLSVACAFEIIGRARQARNVREALALELAFTWRSMSHGEFVEGVRAQVIDKDRNPRWNTARLEDVTPERIAQMLAPVEADLVV